MGENQATPSDAAERNANADARAHVLGWFRRTFGLIPTPWLITGVGAVLLAATAMFGGLNSAPTQPLPELVAGGTFHATDLEVTVTSAELRSEKGNAPLYPDTETGGLLLVVAVDVVNTADVPRSSTAALNGVRIDGHELRLLSTGYDSDSSISRADDGRLGPQLQPDVPVPLLLTWRIDADDFTDGEEITVVVPTSTHFVGQTFVSGDYWAEYRDGARVTVSLEEVPTL